MRITTKTGDRGHTSLLTGETVRKDHPIIVSVGASDELNCRLGMAKLHVDRYKATITKFQDVVMQIAAYISSKGAKDCSFLEKEQHLMDVLVVEYGNDIGERFKLSVPGKNIASSYIHLARTACRDFERSLMPLFDTFEVDDSVLKYVNRLSDLLYLMAVIAEKNDE